MNKAAQIKQFVKQDLWTTDLDTVHIVQRVGIQALRLAIAVALEVRHRLLDAQGAGHDRLDGSCGRCASSAR